jgi:hypothetical protein
MWQRAGWRNWIAKIDIEASNPKESGESLQPSDGTSQRHHKTIIPAKPLEFSPSNGTEGA